MECNSAIQTEQEPPIGLPKCSKCGESKPSDEFYPHASNKSGRKSVCKDCLLSRQRERYATKKQGTNLEREVLTRYAGPPGEYADEQMTSVIRTLADLEHQSNQAHADAKARIEAVEAEKAKVIDGITSRIESLRQELKRMCAQRRKGGKSVKLNCIYGSVRYYEGELSVALYPAVAYANKGKP